MHRIMRAFARCGVVCGFVLLPLLLTSSVCAQQLATANINGTVTDPSGKSLGNVVVSLTNVRQGTVRIFTTGSDGVFSFATLEAAGYTLSADGASGFATWNQ